MFSLVKFISSQMHLTTESTEEHREIYREKLLYSTLRPLRFKQSKVLFEFSSRIFFNY
jgi:hypothetical protein